MVAMGGVARIGECAGAVGYLLEHGLEIEARTDAQARLAERRETGTEGGILAAELVRAVGAGL